VGVCHNIEGIGNPVAIGGIKRGGGLLPFGIVPKERRDAIRVRLLGKLAKIVVNGLAAGAIRIGCEDVSPQYIRVIWSSEQGSTHSLVRFGMVF
jgi:hypothetical protein